MAQAICNDEIARRLGLSPETIGNGPIRALSAGLSANPSRPFTDASIVALRAMGVLPHAHASRPVTAELVAEAELVFCMTEDQRRELVARFPKAADKIHRLDPDGDIDDPSGRGEDAYRVMAARLQDLIRRRLPALGT
jgi:protein-tyrosine phosphatase